LRSPQANERHRRHRIIQAALEVIGEHGVQGATVARIAKAAGVTSGALYSHFPGRTAILLASLDEVYREVFASFLSSTSSDPARRMIEICGHHADTLMSGADGGHAHLFLEFVASTRDERVREALKEREGAAMSYLTSVFQQFEDEARLPRTADPETIACLIAAWAWIGNVAVLIGLTPGWQTRVWFRLLELLIASTFGDQAARDSGARCPGSEATRRKDRPQHSQSHGKHAGLPAGPLFTVTEVANILKVSPDAVFAMLERRQIIAVRSDNEVRIPRWSLIALLDGAAAAWGGNAASMSGSMGA
jgi:AcrR family transcriptional regulator